MNPRGKHRSAMDQREFLQCANRRPYSLCADDAESTTEDWPTLYLACLVQPKVDIPVEISLYGKTAKVACSSTEITAALCRLSGPWANCIAAQPTVNTKAQALLLDNIRMTYLAGIVRTKNLIQ